MDLPESHKKTFELISDIFPGATLVTENPLIAVERVEDESYLKQHRFYDGLTLKEYVEYLLNLGKRGADPEFQVLMKVFNRNRIIAFAKEYLEKNKPDTLK